MDSLLEIEKIIVEKLEWPAWTLRINASLTALVLVTWFLQQALTRNTNSKPSDDKMNKTGYSWEFRLFQLQYLSVYLITMLADWLQGTHMYTLYSSYGVAVGTLFLTGFASSALFGTFLGIYVDTWGRKFGCIVFCLLEVVINLLEHIPSMPVLLFGRVLGGLSTSLLFTAFESWMVSEHRRRGFHEDLLASTFSFASAGNGIAAIVAGFCAQLAADVSGDIGPFQLAIALTIVALVLIFSWRENYGLDESNNKKNDDGSARVHDSGLFANVKYIAKHGDILMLGLSQACFEGAMFTFVFMWVPTLLALKDSSGVLHTGLVFSSFMLAMTFGGMLFGLLLPMFGGGTEVLCSLVYITAAISMAVPLVSFDFWSVLVSFLILETMVGMFSSCGAMLRSKYYPEEKHSSIMSVFRLPLNILVVTGTTLADRANSEESRKMVFGLIVITLSVAAILQISLCFYKKKQKAT